MYYYCKDESDYLMKMLEKGVCFHYWEGVNEFMDNDLLNLRYMKKRFGYLFFDESTYIKKVDGRNAIFVNKEHQFVCRNPNEEHYHAVDETKSPLTREYYIANSIPMEDTVRYHWAK